VGRGDGRDEPVLRPRLRRPDEGGTVGVTPELSGSILPGITRESLLVLAKELGCQVTERRISAQEWLEGCASGAITEVFACGTAAVITPGRAGQARRRRGRRGHGAALVVLSVRASAPACASTRAASGRCRAGCR
jgi:hypothetical protein